MKCSFRVTRFLRVAALVLLLALLTSVPVSSQTIRILFLHHSTGENLINGGGVREGLAARGYEFYDHGYNGDGLRLADGSYNGMNFNVPDDNTDPDGFARIFAQPLHDPPDNTFSYLMQYDVIIFKSCFPVSNIGSDEQLAEYQSHYLSIRDRMDQYPNKLFIIVTQPPQVPGSSDRQESQRARAFSQWLQSDDYLAGHPNVFVFDFFDLLAGSDDFLRPEYRVDDYDAHPNERANEEIGPLFVDLIDQAIQVYFGGQAPPAEPPAEPPADLPPAEVDAIEPPGAGSWSPYPDDQGSTVECNADADFTHSGAPALRMQFAIVPNGWADCDHSFDTPQDWSAADGLSLWLYAENNDQGMTLMLFSGDPEASTPFEIYFEIPPGNWQQVVLTWSDFVRASWADEGGLSELDPARINGYGFSVGAGDGDNEDTLWVSDVTLIGETSAPPDEEPTAPVEEPEEDTEEGTGDEEEAAGGGPCPASALALPLATLTVVWFTRQYDSRRRPTA